MANASVSASTALTETAAASDGAMASAATRTVKVPVYPGAAAVTTVSLPATMPRTQPP